jgi:hypothetical protein
MLSFTEETQDQDGDVRAATDLNNLVAQTEADDME